MVRNYFKIAFRNIFRNWSYSTINTVGLSTGIALCLLIILWVNDELAYDRFHENHDRIYRGLWEARYGDNEWKIPLVPVPLGTALATEFPEVEATTQLYSGGMTMRKDDDFVREQGVLFIDSSFFDIFTIEFLEGEEAPESLSPNALILSRTAAKKYFGDAPPIGQSIVQNDGKVWEVTGVVEDLPEQSHFQFDMLASIKNLSHLERRKDQWSSAAVYTYFLARPGTDIDALQGKLKTYVDNLLAESYSGEGDYSAFPFQALSDIHLKSNLEYELSANGNITYVYIFSFVAFLILLLACVNFVNLATARSITRAKEVGIRKILGSKRDQIAGQFFIETFLQVVFSVLAGLFLVELVMPYFNQLTGKTLGLLQIGPAVLTLLATGLIALITFLTGILPATFLSAVDAVKVLKGNLISGSGRNWLREGLVVGQFCISTCLIIGMLVIKQQLEFTQNQRLGFDKEHTLIINRAGALQNQYDTFLEEVSGLAGVRGAACGQSFPGKEFDSTVFAPEQPANYEQTSLNYCFVNTDYAELLSFEFAEGRNFSTQFRTDSMACLLNETAAKRLGWTDPVGKFIDRGNDRKHTVIGVIKDFHYQSLHHEVEPLILFLSSWKLPHIAVKLHAGNPDRAVAEIKDLWQQMAPQSPLEFTFLDEDYQKLYANEQKMGNIFTVFSALALFIACLGLFGLASFLVNRRSKEIAIRKVIGASVAAIIHLLSRDFLKLVGVAVLLAIPISWYMMNRWLQDFAYHIDMQWWVFGLAAVIAVVIAFMAVGFQSITAAIANPVRRLRDQ